MQIRQSTNVGRPLGSREFVRDLERQLARQLAPRKGGRPKKSAVELETEQLLFAVGGAFIPINR